MRRALVLAALGLALLHSGCAKPVLDQSSDAFFPSQFAARIREIQKFPLAWWNYVVVEIPPAGLCAGLKAESGIARAGCEHSLADFAGIARAWSEDYPRRHPPPETHSALVAAFDRALVRASAPLGSEALEILRSDPFASYEELLELARSANPLQLDYRAGYSRLASGDLAVIPVQLRFAASDSAGTAAVAAAVDSLCAGRCGKVFLLGPHFAAWKNRDRIIADVNTVSLVGSALFAVLLLALALLRRWAFLLLVPPVVGGMAIGAWITSGLFGSIHGLTLAFGSAIVGLAFDYAYHGFSRESDRRAWTSNFVGFLTSLVVLLTIAASTIPLLRQLMFFSIVGLSIAFALVFFTTRALPRRWRLAPLPIRPGALGAAPACLALAALALVAFLLFVKPELSLQQLEFQTPEESAITKSLFGGAAGAPPLLLVRGENGETDAALAAEAEFARANGFRLLSPVSIFPPAAVQAENLGRWTEFACTGRAAWEKRLSTAQAKFFAPFLTAIACERIRGMGGPQSPRLAGIDELFGFRKDGRVISVFQPRSESEAEAIRRKFPEAQSFRALVAEFPRLLARELAWMAPLSLLLVALVLAVYYRSAGAVLAALLPFYTAVGFVALATVALGLTFSFVSFIAMLMIFGLSIDYGVFATDHFRSRSRESGVWTALVFAGATNALGFAPLLACRHPVLRQLGQPLFFGTLGTLVGAFVVIPWWVRKTAKAGADA